MFRIKHFIKNMDKNQATAAIAVLGVMIAGVLIYANSNPGFSLQNIIGSGISGQQVAEKAVKYINDNGLSQSPATLVGNATEESGLVKFEIQIGSDKFDSYATKDGKFLFPRVLVMGEEQNNNELDGKTAEEILASIKKNDKPMLEAYIVSRCPFGLQMQRMMAEAIKSVPELGKYMKVMYMGSVSGDGKTITAMHGEAEANENLRQICIRDEQASKYWDYVSCQMKAAGTEVGCEKSTGVDSAKLSVCVSDTSKGVAFAKKDFELSDKYNVTGSPTLVLNEAVLPEFDSDKKPVFGGRTSDALKTMVCNAFNSKATFCSTKLNTTEAAVGFSATYSSGSSAGNAGANCGQ